MVSKARLINFHESELESHCVPYSYDFVRHLIKKLSKSLELALVYWPKLNDPFASRNHRELCVCVCVCELKNSAIGKMRHKLNFISGTLTDCVTLNKEISLPYYYPKLGRNSWIPSFPQSIIVS